MLLRSSADQTIQRFAEELDRHPNRLVKLTPSHLLALSELCKGSVSGQLITVAGGEPLSRAVVSKWKLLFPKSVIVNHYGPTEATVGVCTYLLPSHRVPDPIPIGRPIANTQVYILDDQRHPVPVGVSGELYIAGAGVARGYLNRPELTAEKFLPDPFRTGADTRMYRTGDLGRWLPDGNIELLGRNDFQVKIRGYRIELGEIEATLAQHSGVHEAVVIAREDVIGKKQLVAYYITGSNDEPSAEQLRSHLSAALPEYMVPAAYVRLESLPLTHHGKLDRKALPMPEDSAYILHEYEAPQGEIETILAAIWVDILMLDKVSRHDDFFSLGGDSLNAWLLINQIRSTMEIEVQLMDIFMASTIVDMAYLISVQLPLLD